MPKTKAGTLKPVIDQLRKTLREKKDAAGAERRALRSRLKRLQRKARRIHRLEQRGAAAAKGKAPEAEAS